MEVWEQATDILSRALKRRKIAFEIDPGEGVFYGPKIDIKFEDAVGRAWQGPTIQVDFNLPQRFGVTAVGEDGQEQSVAMVHRTVLGSMERFMASLTEHYGAAFPVWLAPVQVVIVPIADRHLDYATKLSARLKKDGRRVEINDRQERVSHKIRQAQLDKIPYMLVVGDNEVDEGTVSVRLRDGQQKSGQPFADFRKLLAKAVKERAKELNL
jgi:threonyl-tRNA synthetase